MIFLFLLLFLQQRILSILSKVEKSPPCVIVKSALQRLFLTRLTVCDNHSVSRTTCSLLTISFLVRFHYNIKHIFFYSTSKYIKKQHNTMNRCELSHLSARHILQTFLHMVQVTLGYILMLAFMTFNVWICISIVLGAGLGYFIFGVQPVIISADHCN